MSNFPPQGYVTTVLGVARGVSLTLVPTTQQTLVLNPPTAPVGSASEFMSTFDIPATTVAFVTNPQTGDYETSFIGVATLTNPSSGTITNATTLKIAGAPVASTNVTITNNYALWIASGNTQMDGNLTVANIGTFGDPASTTPQLIIKGGSGGNNMLQLQRTSGSTITFSFALSGGGLSFTDSSNGRLVMNLFGNGSQSQIYIGQKDRTTADAGASYVLAAVRLTAAAGTDQSTGNLNIISSLGTGAGTPGSIVFQTGLTKSTGTTVHTASTRMTISAGTVTTDASTITFADKLDFVFGTGTGTKIGTASTQLLGFWNATPVDQPAAITSLTDNTGATANDTIENVPAASGDGGGLAGVSAAANVATVSSVNTALTAVENDIADLTAKVNTILSRLREPGIIAT